MGTVRNVHMVARGAAVVAALLFAQGAHAFGNTYADWSCATASPRFTITATSYSGVHYSTNLPSNPAAITVPSTLSAVEAQIESVGADGTTRTQTSGTVTYTCEWKDVKMTSTTAYLRECRITAAAGAGSNPGLIGSPLINGTGTITKTCVTDTSCPEAGTELTGVAYFRNVSDTVTSYKRGDNWCQVEGTGGVCMSIPGVEATTFCPKWQYTGLAGSDPGSTVAPGDTDPTTDKVCTADGKNCITRNLTNNCGTVNGEYVCVGGSPTPGNCLTTSKGQTVCTSNAANPLTNPPAPGTSTDPMAPGTVTPSAVQLGQPSTASGGGYQGGNVTHVWGPGGTGAGTPGTGDPAGEEEGEGTDPCGIEGEPPCNVKIDETDVPEDASELETALAEAIEARDELESDLREGLGEAAASNDAFGSWVPFNGGTLIPSGSCTSMDIEFFNGDVKPFPGSEGCAAMDNDIKPVIAFFLYLFTAYGITMAVIRARSEH